MGKKFRGYLKDGKKTELRNREHKQRGEIRKRGKTPDSAKTAWE